MSETASYQVWCRKGGMLVRADALPSDDPENPYQQLVAQGLNPSDYGIVRDDLEAIMKDRSRESLAAEILELREQITGYMFHC